MRSQRASTSIIIALVIFAVAALIFAYFFQRSSTMTISTKKNAELYDLSKIESTVTSSDGESHPISVKFTLAVDEKAKSSLDKQSIETQVKKIMETLDYDKISSEGNNEYIKEEVKKGLAGYVDDAVFKGIYIRDINSGSIMFADPDEEVKTNKPTRNDVIQGFRNFNK